MFEGSIRSVASSEDEEKKEREGFFEKEDYWEVPRAGVVGNGTQEIVGVATSHSSKDHKETEEIFGQWFDNPILTHKYYGVFSDAPDSPIIGELSSGNLGNNFPGHVPGVGNIEYPYHYKTYEDTYPVLPTIPKDIEEATFPGAWFITDRKRKTVKHSKESKDREEEYGRKLGKLSESEEDATDEDIFPRRVSEETNKVEKRYKDKGSNADIGRNVVAMSNDIGISKVEESSKESSNGTSKLSSPAIDKESQKECDKNEGETSPEGDSIGVVAIFVEDLITKSPLGESPGTSGPFGKLAEVEGIAAFPQRERLGHNWCWTQEEKGGPSEILEERWVLWIDTHILILDVAIASGDMSLFVHGG